MVSIVDYVHEFKELRSIVTGVDERNLEHVFFNGLKLEMKNLIKMKEPVGITQHIAAVIGMEGSVFCKSVGEIITTTALFPLIQSVVLVLRLPLNTVRGLELIKELKIVAINGHNRSILMQSWMKCGEIRFFLNARNRILKHTFVLIRSCEF